MALKDLQLEAKAMQHMFDEANKSKAGGLRFELARDSQEHTIDAKELARQLTMHTERPFKGDKHYGKRSPEVTMMDDKTGFVGGDKSKVIQFKGKTGSGGVVTQGEAGRNAQRPEYKKWVDKYGEDYKVAIFANFKKELEAFCEAYVAGIRAAVKSNQYAVEEPGSSNKKVIFTYYGSKERDDVYGKLQTFCKKVATEVVESNEDFVTLFAKSSSSISQLTNIGHTMAVAEEKAGILAKSSQKAADSKVINSSKLKVLNAQIQKAFKDLELSIDFSTVRDVDFINKTLTDNRTVLSNAESQFFNQARSGAPKKAGLAGMSETDLGNKIADLLRAFKKELDNEYKNAKKASAKAGSQTMLQAAQAMILYSAIEGVSKKTLKIKSKLTKPVTGKKKSKVPVTKQKFKRGHKVMKPNTIGLGGAKPAQEIPPMPPRFKSESGTSLAPLIALLNSKLPQTVARNMGPPGLENQTGRFASSVQVTDVSRTAQGFPSVGYDYRRNPYQVFEMGSGQAPWATPDRDPRKVIDQSIREIAAQFAIGRFYTRRI